MFMCLDNDGRDSSQNLYQNFIAPFSAPLLCCAPWRSEVCRLPSTGVSHQSSSHPQSFGHTR